MLSTVQTKTTFDISKSARKAFWSMLRNLKAPRGSCMRIQTRGSQLVLGMNSLSGQDAEFRHGGEVVLVVSQATLQKCDGLMLDFDQREGFVFREMD